MIISNIYRIYYLFKIYIMVSDMYKLLNNKKYNVIYKIVKQDMYRLLIIKT